jgi:hypothetical protein
VIEAFFDGANKYGADDAVCTVGSSDPIGSAVLPLTALGTAMASINGRG